MLKRLFGKHKSKEKKVIYYINSHPNDRLTDGGLENSQTQNQFKVCRRRSNSLNEEPVLIKRCIKKPGKSHFRSYPPSPSQHLKHSTGYQSEQQSKPQTTIKSSLEEPSQSSADSNPYNNNTKIVYTATVPQNNVRVFKPRATLGSSDPFPFEVPNDPVPRTSLFYDVRYGDDESRPDQNTIAEKPNENQFQDREQIPSTSLYKEPLVTPERENENDDMRSTIVRVRPYSLANFAQNDSVKLMPLKPERSFFSNFKKFRPKHSSKEVPVLVTEDGKVLKPVKTDKITRMSIASKREVQPFRLSLIQPGSKNYSNSIDQVQVSLLEDPDLPRKSVLKPPPIRQSVAERANMARMSIQRTSFSLGEQPILFKQDGRDSIRRSTILPSNRYSVVRAETEERRPSSVDKTLLVRESQDQRRFSIVKEAVLNQDNETFPRNQAMNNQIVYAVPVVNTRGRTRSILQQSVQTLTSKDRKNEQVYSKNLRFSRDLDVFSANERQRSVSPQMPGFINMEKGQPMLVSEVLNPITSLFISDLKDPIPKDPLTKPKEANVWVKPREYQTQPASPKPVSRVVQPVYKESVRRSRVVNVPRRISSRSIAYSTSNESFEEPQYVKKQIPSQRRPQYHHVYTAETKDNTLPLTSHQPINSKVSPDGNSHLMPTVSHDSCGLCPENKSKNTMSVKMVSSSQQTDIEEEISLVCYPSEKALKNSVSSPDYGSRLRWRIIIKRGEEK